MLVAHLHGNAAQISVEIGRGNVPSGAQPSFLELEEALSAIPPQGEGLIAVHGRRKSDHEFVNSCLLCGEQRLVPARQGRASFGLRASARRAHHTSGTLHMKTELSAS